MKMIVFLIFGLVTALFFVWFASLVGPTTWLVTIMLVLSAFISACGAILVLAGFGLAISHLVKALKRN